MADLFSAGGVFMIPMTLIAVAILALFVKTAIGLFGASDAPPAHHRSQVNLVLQLSVFVFFVGVLSQAIGLFEAFQFIEEVGSVSPAMLAGGFKVSMIASLYGLFLFLLGFIGWMVLRYQLDRAA